MLLKFWIKAQNKTELLLWLNAAGQWIHLKVEVDGQLIHQQLRLCIFVSMITYIRLPGGLFFFTLHRFAHAVETS